MLVHAAASPACGSRCWRPVVLVLCVIGAYALNNTMQSVYVLLIFGVFGYVLVKAGFPLAPLILGLILGDQIEINLIRAIMTDEQSLAVPDAADLGRAAGRRRALRRARHLAAPAPPEAHRRRGGHGFLMSTRHPGRAARDDPEPAATRSRLVLSLRIIASTSGT